MTSLFYMECMQNEAASSALKSGDFQLSETYYRLVQTHDHQNISKTSFRSTIVSLTSVLWKHHCAVMCNRRVDRLL